MGHTLESIVYSVYPGAYILMGKDNVLYMSYEYVIIYVCRVYICCSDICIMIYIINMYLVLYIGQEYMCNVYMLEEYKPCRIK